MNVKRNLLKKRKKDYKYLSMLYKKLLAERASGEVITGWKEWIYDNFYLLESIYTGAQKTVRRTTIRRTRAITLAENIISKNEILSEEEIVNMINDFQKENYFFDDEILSIFPLLQHEIIRKIAKTAKADCDELDKARDMRILFINLKKIPNLNIKNIFNQTSKLHEILLNDPAKIYQNQDETSQNSYRVELKKQAGNNVFEYTKQLLKIAINENKHIGEIIYQGKKEYKQEYAFLYIFVSFVLSYLLFVIHYSLLFFFPLLFILMEKLLTKIFAKIVPPRVLPRIDYKTEDMPKTLIVLSCLALNEKSMKDYMSRLERYYLANKENNLCFSLLVDFPESKTESEKTNKGILAIQKNEIDKLNDKYGKIFYCFQRKRVYDKLNDIYMAYERKRGAISELIELIKTGKKGSFIKPPKNMDFKYIIALDIDTKLGIDVAKKMIGTMEHPLNSPVILNGKVVKGYGIMQGQIATNIKSGMKNAFTKIFGGSIGANCYQTHSSETFFDVFGESSFSGKGIINVDVFYEIMPKAIKANTILSHDFIEGSYLRTGYLSDITLLDETPSKYSAYQSRKHRWYRGDIQSSPYLFSNINKLSKFKLLLNVIKVLEPVFLLTLIFISFMVNVNFLFIPVIYIFIGSILNINLRFRKNVSEVLPDFYAGLLYNLIYFLTLPYEAYLSLDAFMRSMYRMLISHKKMLEWKTAEMAEMDKKGNFANYMPTIFVSLSLILINVYSLPLAILWNIMPFVINMLEAEAQRNTEINPDDEYMLKNLSRRIFQYYLDFADSKTNYLIPDNYQENPPQGLALRTSSTNIGLHLNALYAGYEMGFMTKKKFIEQVNNITDTIEKLEKLEGNLYNWYDIVTLNPLSPKYVSTVDSGNFCVSILLMIEALNKIKKDTNYRDKLLDGLRITLGLAGVYGDKLELEDLEKIKLNENAFWGRVAKNDIEDIKQSVNNGMKDGEIDSLIDRLQKIFDETDLSILYDKNAFSFSIGYDAENGELTNSYYDIFASEARNTYFIAIATKQIPKKTWDKLSRLQVKQNGKSGLISWSGSAFEYLMPFLYLPSDRGSELYETYKFMLSENVNNARKQGIDVWGISESAYNRFDRDLNYQYKAFGCPNLAVSKASDDEIVVSPYAGIMALSVDQEKAIKNLNIMNDNNFAGRYGLYEAIDYTPTHLLASEKHSIVKTYMAHHLGMSILALANVLEDNVIQKVFTNSPLVAGHIDLIAEKLNDEPALLTNLKGKNLIKQAEQEIQEYVREIEVNIEETDDKKYHIISNGKCKAIASSYGELEVYYKDELFFKPKTGLLFYINDNKTGELFSPMYSPIYNKKVKYNTVFSPTSAEFIVTLDNELVAKLNLYFSSASPMLIQNLKISNTSSEARSIDVFLYAEPVLQTKKAYESHRAFSKLFLTGSNLDNTFFITRRPRGEKDRQTVLANTIISEDDGFDFETDKEKIFTRKRGLKEPLFEFTNKQKQTANLITAFKKTIMIKANSCTQVTLASQIIASPKDAFQNNEELDSLEQVYDNMRVLTKISEQVANSTPFITEKALDLLPFVLGEKYEVRRGNVLGQQHLWKFGISGDNQILLHFCNYEKIAEIETAIRIHAFYTMKGLNIDLVLIVPTENDYRGMGHLQIYGLLERFGKGSIKIINQDELSSQEETLFIAVGIEV